jgi:hypothetical protein
VVEVGDAGNDGSDGSVAEGIKQSLFGFFRPIGRLEECGMRFCKILEEHSMALCGSGDWEIHAISGLYDSDFSGIPMYIINKLVNYMHGFWDEEIGLDVMLASKAFRGIVQFKHEKRMS